MNEPQRPSLHKGWTESPGRGVPPPTLYGTSARNYCLGGKGVQFAWGFRDCHSVLVGIDPQGEHLLEPVKFIKNVLFRGGAMTFWSKIPTGGNPAKVTHSNFRRGSPREFLEGILEFPQQLFRGNPPQETNSRDNSLGQVCKPWQCNGRGEGWQQQPRVKPGGFRPMQPGPSNSSSFPPPFTFQMGFGCYSPTVSFFLSFFDCFLLPALCPTHAVAELLPPLWALLFPLAIPPFFVD